MRGHLSQKRVATTVAPSVSAKLSEVKPPVTPALRSSSRSCARRGTLASGTLRGLLSVALALLSAAFCAHVGDFFFFFYIVRTCSHLWKGHIKFTGRRQPSVLVLSRSPASPAASPAPRQGLAARWERYFLQTPWPTLRPRGECRARLTHCALRLFFFPLFPLMLSSTRQHTQGGVLHAPFRPYCPPPSFPPLHHGGGVAGALPWLAASPPGCQYTCIIHSSQCSSSPAFPPLSGAGCKLDLVFPYRENLFSPVESPNQVYGEAPALCPCSVPLPSLSSC